MSWADNSNTFNFLYIFLLQDFCKAVINSTLLHSKTEINYHANDTTAAFV